MKTFNGFSMNEPGDSDAQVGNREVAVLEELIEKSGKYGTRRVYDYRDWDSLEACLTQLGGDTSNTYGVLITDNCTISANITKPTNIYFMFEHSGKFTIGSGVVITNGIELDKSYNRQIIDCALADVPLITGAEYLTPEMYGAAGDGLKDGTGTDDTLAVQKALNSLNYVKKLILSKNYIVTDELQFPANIKGCIIQGPGYVSNNDPAEYAGGGTLIYNGTLDNTKAILRMSGAGCTDHTFDHINFYCNELCGYGVTIGSTAATGFITVKQIRFESCFVWLCNTAGWRLGDQTNTGVDTDLWNPMFYDSHVRSSVTDSGGWIVDANNAYNVQFYGCSGGRYNEPSGRPKFVVESIRGGDILWTGGFIDKLADDGWGFIHNSGSLSVYGCHSEWHKILSCTAIGTNANQMILDGVTVNNLEGYDGDYSVDTRSGVLIMRGCTFVTRGGGITDSRKIRCDTYLEATNVDLGTFPEAEYELLYPERCIIEGVRVGQHNNLLANGCFNLWYGTGTNAYPFGWIKQTGTGGDNAVSPTTTGNVIGKYALDIDVTVSDTVFCGIQQTIRNCQYMRGRKLYGIAVGSVEAGKTPRIDFVNESGTSLSQSTVEVLNDNTFIAFVQIDVDSVTDSVIFRIGLRNQTGHLYLDNVYVGPESWNNRVPALIALLRFSSYYNSQLESLKGGVVPLGHFWSGRRLFCQNAALASPIDSVKGDVVLNSEPETYEADAWQTVTAGTPGTARVFGCHWGTTAQRTSLSTNDKSFLYYDTDINQLLFWNGSGWIQITGTATKLPAYNKAALPNANTYWDCVIMVADDVGGYVQAFSDGTNWRRVTDRAIIS